MNYISCIRNIADSSGLYSLTTTVRPDSLTLLYSFSTVTGNTYPELYPHIGPTFRGDVGKMTKKLEEEFAKWKLNIANDSVTIFQALIEKSGRLGKLNLVEGKKSVYTDKVLDFLTAEATAWLPRFDGSGKIPWEIRISVRVNRDQTMKISILEEISSTLYVH